MNAKIVSKSVASIIGLLMLFCFSSCDDKSSNVIISHMPVQVDEDGKWGLISRDGTVVLEDEFISEPSPVINNIFFALDKNGYTVYRLEENNYKEIVGLNNLASVGYLEDNRLPICRKGECISVVDKDGNTIFQLDNIDDIPVKSCRSYSNGIMPVELADGTTAYIDIDGNKLFGRRFACGSIFRNGYAVVGEIPNDSTESDKENTFVFIDTTGEKIFMPEDDFEIDDDQENGGVSFVSQLISLVRKDRFYIYQFDGSSRCKCPAKVEMINYVLDDYYIFSNDDEEMGVMDYNGEQLVRPHYKRLMPIGNLFLAKKDKYDEDIYLIDIKGAQINTLEGEDIVRPEDEFFDFPIIIETEDDEMYLLDNKGNKLNKKIVANIEDDFEDIGVVYSNVFDTEKILNSLLRITGNGSGIPTDSIAYFRKEGSAHCYPYNVSFLRTAKIQDLKEKKSANSLYSVGEGYRVLFDVTFDEEIAKYYDGELSLSRSAWLKQMGFTARFDQSFVSERVARELSSKLCSNGCNMEYEKSRNCDSYILLRSNNNEQTLLLQVDKNNIYCYVVRGTDPVIVNWKKWIDDQLK